MSNYPNMSYCMCENTNLALEQILEAMQEDPAEFFTNLSRTERRALGELYQKCNDLAQFMDEQAEELGEPL